MLPYNNAAIYPPNIIQSFFPALNNLWSEERFEKRKHTLLGLTLLKLHSPINLSIFTVFMKEHATMQLSIVKINLSVNLTCLHMLTSNISDFDTKKTDREKLELSIEHLTSVSRTKYVSASASK